MQTTPSSEEGSAAWIIRLKCQDFKSPMQLSLTFFAFFKSSADGGVTSSQMTMSSPSTLGEGETPIYTWTGPVKWHQY